MAKKRNQNGAVNGNAAAPQEATAAYFLSLTLRNVRCFGDEPQTLDLSDGNGRPARWTVLLGNNGTGKTTILQALAGFEMIPPGAVPGIIVADSIGHMPETFSRTILRFLSSSFQRSPNVTTNVSVKLAVGEALLKHPVAYDIIGLNWESKGALATWSPAPGTPPSINELRCYGYGASRRLSFSAFSSAEVDDATASLFSDDAILRNAEEWLLRLDYSASKTSDVQEKQKLRLKFVKQLLIDILPKEEVADIRFTSPTSAQPTPSIEFQTPYGWVGLRQLGHGFRTLIAWMVDFTSRLVERYPDHPTPQNLPAVVLVDEIDLHMHPIWQRQLMTYLTECFPNTQFIVTAHSPLIVQAAAEDANIALLRREGDHVVIDNEVDYIRGWDVAMLLTSDLFGLPSARPPQYDALFERRKTLLLKPKLNEKEKKELESLNEKVYQLPYGETAEQAKTSALIQETLELLKTNERQVQ